MPRPKCCRRVGEAPACRIFKPLDAPVSVADEVVLTMDEFEAIRLADFDGLYQGQAAERMSVSRQTFGRIVATARAKIARALVESLALRIEGGAVEMSDRCAFRCLHCKHSWDIPRGSATEGRPEGCPACRSTDISRQEQRKTGKVRQCSGD